MAVDPGGEADGGRREVGGLYLVAHGPSLDAGSGTGDTLAFRYSHLNTDGGTASGRCVSEVTVDPAGRFRLLETWSWESREGSGTNVVEEISAVTVAGTCTLP